MGTTNLVSILLVGTRIYTAIMVKNRNLFAGAALAHIVLASPAPQQLDYKDAATAAQFLKSRIRKAMAELGNLADMDRGVEEQEVEIGELEEKIKRQRMVLARLAAVAEERADVMMGG